MSRSLFSHIRSLLVACLLLLALPDQLFADESNLQQQIRHKKELQQRISTLLQDIKKTQNARGKLEQKLTTTEREIGALGSSLYKLDRQLKKQNKSLNLSRQQEQVSLRQLARQQTVLQEQVRAAYLMGRQQRLRVLLNQQQPEKLSRILTYYDYLARARTARMQQISRQVEDLRQLQDSIRQQEQTLQVVKAERLADKQKLETHQAERKTAIAALSLDLRQSGKELEQLKQDELRLNKLLDNLQRALADVEIPGQQQQTFKQLKGTLPWPSKGRLSASFGSRKIGDIRWDGVVIDAPGGQPVKAIHAGRIAYADWLRGYGLLLILDHGDGYMSLYGYNQSLFKEVGDWVEPGEIVALVGSSGGRARSGMYFGVRYKGKARNPKSWCRKPRGAQVG